MSLCVCAISESIVSLSSYTAMHRLLLLLCLFKCVIVGLKSTKKCTLNHISPRLLSKTRKIRATKLSNGELTDKQESSRLHHERKLKIKMDYVTCIMRKVMLQSQTDFQHVLVYCEFERIQRGMCQIYHKYFQYSKILY